ncbi:DNA-directed RNA polymerase subunit K [Patescibacteria group bacterium]|nr:DNA-directed RNA polymerase subunit K [Patescibacteria group bacterium]
MSDKKFSEIEKFSKYEVARILGARALQISMNSPLLIKITKEDLERINYDSLKLAEIELESGALPISVKRPFPQKKDEKLKRVKEEKVNEESLKKNFTEEEEEIAKEGEIMELVNPTDENDEEESEEDASERE